ncbi:DUF6247 family protein [Planotetraspora kaengkrachanensis]|uniref:Uncharacterized protein n=1 Tax=Planotetraspora kaengkrachanensis TaxID=575193 RepID=A0A8J3V966_9ACTN|nr:DUF6247 family protein [Planotetraspora kaengkrachanensis]GIG81944.1 hypothetical protein Pka01_50710 [Planotetraspora kaengkrachanensis]
MTAQPHEHHRRSPARIRASLRDDRSPRAIRAALPAEDLDAFDREYREALRRAGDELDLTPLHDCVESWWRQAVLKADPVAYANMVEQAEDLQRRAEGGEPVGGVPWDDAFEARLRRRTEAGE